MSGKSLGLAALVAIVLLVASFYALREFTADSGVGLDRNGRVEQSADEGQRRPTRSTDTEFRKELEAASPVVQGIEAKTEATTEGLASISGRAVDPDGRPLAELDVLLGRNDSPEGRFPGLDFDPTQTEPPRKIRTDDAGRFRFDRVEIGHRYRVIVRSPRHISYEAAIEPNEARDHDLGDLVLRLGASLAGRVTAKGLPVAGVRVKADQPGSGPQVFFRRMMTKNPLDDAREATTNAEGRFVIAGLEAGRWDVLTEHESYQPAAEKGLELAERQEKQGIEIAIEEGLLIRGRISDAQGKAVAGAQIQAFDMPSFGQNDTLPTGSRVARSDDLGEFVLRGLQAGNYNVHISQPGYMDLDRSLRPAEEVIELSLAASALVFGQVSDQTSGEPIAQARIEVQNRSFRMVASAMPQVLRGREAAELAGFEGEAGLFAIADIRSPQIEIEIDAPGYGRVRSSAIIVGAGEKRRFDIELTPEARVTGRVLDPQSSPVAGASVALSRPGGDQFFFSGRATRARDRSEPKLTPQNPESATTDAEGRYVISGVAAGEFEILASVEGFSPSPKQSITLAAGEKRELDLTLVPSSGIVGQALDAKGIPAKGARVTLRKRGNTEEMMMPGMEDHSAIADADGHFGFKDLAPGDWRVTLESDFEQGSGFVMSFGDDDKKVHRDVTLPPGEVVEVMLTAATLARVTGVVRTAGKPVEGASVSVGDEMSFFDFGGGGVKTDANGRFAIESVAPGEKTITVKAEGAPLPTKLAITVVAEVENSVDVELPGGAIRGKITASANGAPVVGVTIEARRIDPEGKDENQRAVSFAISDGGGEVQTFESGSGRVRSDEDGRFRLDFLADGDYQLEVKGSDYLRVKREAIEVRDGRVTRDVDFQLDKGLKIEIEIVSKSQGFHFVSLTSTDEGPSVEEQKGTRSGKTTISGLRAGSYKLTLRNIGNEGGLGKNEEREVHLTTRDEKVRFDLD